MEYSRYELSVDSFAVSYSTYGLSALRKINLKNLANCFNKTSHATTRKYCFSCSQITDGSVASTCAAIKLFRSTHLAFGFSEGKALPADQ